MFDIFDRNNSGEIDYREFVDALRPDRQVSAGQQGSNPSALEWKASICRRTRSEIAKREVETVPQTSPNFSARTNDKVSTFWMF